MRKTATIAVSVLWAAGWCAAGEPEHLPTPDDAPPPGAAPWDRWTIRFEPMIWAPALRGDFKPPGGARVDVRTVDADDNEITPAGRFTLKAGEWSVEFRGFFFDLDKPAATIEVAGFDLTAGRTVWTPIDDPHAEVRVAFDVFAGARLHSVEATTRLAGTTGRGDNVWAEPAGGLRLTLDLPHGFGVSVAGGIGGLPVGDDSSFSWDITASFSWMFHENAGLEIGFRNLAMDLSEGKGAGRFDFDALLAGLFGAVVIRF